MRWLRALHYLGKTYGTSPIELLRLPLGEFELLLRIYEEGSAHEMIQAERERQRMELEARRGAK